MTTSEDRTRLARLSRGVPTNNGAQQFANVTAQVAAGPAPPLPTLQFAPGGVDALGNPLPNPATETLPNGFALASFRARTLRGQQDYLFTLPVAQRRAILALLSLRHSAALLSLSINPTIAHNQALAFTAGRTYHPPARSGSYPDGTPFLYREGRPLSKTGSAVLNLFTGTPSVAQTEAAVQRERYGDALRDAWRDVTSWWEAQASRLPDALRGFVQQAAAALGVSLGTALLLLVGAGLVILNVR